MKRIHAFIEGKVQGVNFRWNTKIKAEKLGIRGWVRNLADGRVEVVAEGSEENIKEFIKFLKKGPPKAKVEKIEINEENPKNEFESFSIVF
ncbi:MAG: acylphosphatase [Candidatus Micrarchaeia archaeon]